MQVTWDELDHITAEDEAGKHKRARDKGPPIPLLDLTEEAFMLGIGDQRTIRESFDSSYHDFIDNCFDPLHLQRISEADIEKFLVRKPKFGTIISHDTFPLCSKFCFRQSCNLSLLCAVAFAMALATFCTLSLSGWRALF
jgi:hypothetical protein